MQRISDLLFRSGQFTNGAYILEYKLMPLIIMHREILFSP